MSYIHKPLPKTVAKLGSLQHHRAVRNLYRRTLKFYKYSVAKFQYDVWDYHAYHIRKQFENNRTLKDAGEVTAIMNEAEEALDSFQEPWENYRQPWDGPRAVAFNYYPYRPKEGFNMYVGQTTYDADWKETVIDESSGKAEIEAWKAKYIGLFREITVGCDDYTQWLAIKKRLEDELRERIEYICSTIKKSHWGWFWDWPYNTINEFSDGYKPNWNLDIAFQDHWDEELWRDIATLDENEQKTLEKYEWIDHRSLRSN
eukprot:UN04079